MPYLRKRGRQITLVHGFRERPSNKVRQQVLYTFYSQIQAREVMEGDQYSGCFRTEFCDQLEAKFPDLDFNWAILAHKLQLELGGLPKVYTGSKRKSPVAKASSQMVKALENSARAGPTNQLHFLKQELPRLELVSQLLQDKIEQVKAHLKGAEVPSTRSAKSFGVEALGRGDLTKAESIFSTLWDAYPGQAEWPIYLGQVELAGRNHSQAQQYFQEACQLIEGGATAQRLSTVGVARSKRSLYRQALRNLAVSYNRQQNYAQAQKVCDKLMHLAGDYWGAKKIAIDLDLNRGHFSKVVQGLEELVKRFPEKSFHGAFAWDHLGQWPVATRCLLHAALNYPLTTMKLFQLPCGELERGIFGQKDKLWPEMALDIQGHLTERNAKTHMRLRAFLQEEKVKKLLMTRKSAGEKLLHSPHSAKNQLIWQEMGQYEFVKKYTHKNI